MTRMWIGVDPESLCDQHLKGEYNEILKYVGGLYRHPHGLAIAIGHAEKQNMDTSVLVNRFYSVKEEMLRRGFTAEKSLGFFVDWFNIGNGFSEKKNIQDLKERRSEACSGDFKESCLT